MELLHKDRSTLTQIFHHIAVMHDLVAHIDGRAEHFQSPVDDVDGAIHPGTEATGVGETNFHKAVNS